MPRTSPELAQKILDFYPDTNGLLLNWYQAIIEGTLPQHHLENLKHRRWNYSDELPDVDVRTLIDANPETEGKHFYKCQTHFQIGLAHEFRSMVEEEVITDPKQLEAIETFLTSDLNFQVGDPKNQERIKRMNDIMDRFISHLEGIIGPTEVDKQK